MTFYRKEGDDKPEANLQKIIACKKRLLNNMIKKCGWTIVVGVIITLAAFKGYSQSTEYISLQNERLKVTPTRFYIAAVIDERKEDNTIGSILMQPVHGKINGTYRLGLKGGIAALKNFVNYSFPADKSLRPLVIKIKELKINETAVTPLRADGKIKLSISFGLPRGEDFVLLSDYTGSAEYQRPPGPPQQVEPLIRSALSNCLLYINNWMNVQAWVNPKLATAVKVSFTDYHEAAEGDTVYYNIRRPLTWNDFQEKNHRATHHGAEVFAGIGYDEDVKLINGVFYVKLAMKVYVPKSASWVSNSNANAYALNHEQRHFDVAKLVAEHFKKRIMDEKLPPENFDGPINVAYLDALREMDKLQKQYDGETNHSIDAFQQRQWDERIDKELQQLGVKQK